MFVNKIICIFVLYRIIYRHNMKRFILKEGANPNYLCTICKIGEVYPIENADKLVKTVVNGYDIIISKDYKAGDIVVYFPVESCICEKYLSNNNLYERGNFEQNSNAEAVKELIVKAEDEKNEEERNKILLQIKAMCGFFNARGRVRILKLRGQYSQGFIAGVDSLVAYDSTLADTDWESLVGTQFNYIDENEFCWKYIPPVKTIQEHKTQSQWKHRMKALKRFDRLIEGQFIFHYDTAMLAEHIREIKPDDVVTISVKLHGTSAIFANVLTNRKLSTWEKIKKFFGFKVKETEYGNIYSSRSVIKNRYVNEGVTDGFYGSDIWGCVNKVFAPYIEEGMTVYGEIVGYIEGTNKFIQAQHDYGCKVGEWKFMPYRITTTMDDGNKKEWNVADVDKWTRDLVAANPELEKKVMFLTIAYHGPMGELYSDLDITNHWHENLLARMKVDTEHFGMELDEPLCKNKVPREGIVVRIDDDKFARAWKLKTLRHYGKEAEQHDKGDTDIEETA